MTGVFKGTAEEIVNDIVKDLITKTPSKELEQKVDSHLFKTARATIGTMINTDQGPHRVTGISFPRKMINENGHRVLKFKILTASGRKAWMNIKAKLPDGIHA